MRTYWLFAFVALCLVGATSAHAKDPVKLATAEPGQVTQPMTKKETAAAMKRQMLANQRQALQKFVHAQLRTGNRTLIHSRSDMQFTRLDDGRWRAWYRAYDLSTVTCSVMPDNTKNIPYIGSATYLEREYEAFAPSKAEVARATFLPAPGKDQPYRKFFQCYKGAWR